MSHEHPMPAGSPLPQGQVRAWHFINESARIHTGRCGPARVDLACDLPFAGAGLVRIHSVCEAPTLLCRASRVV